MYLMKALLFFSCVIETWPLYFASSQRAVAAKRKEMLKPELSVSSIAASVINDAKVGAELLRLFEEKIEDESLNREMQELVEALSRYSSVPVELNKCSLCTAASVLLSKLSKNMSEPNLTELIVRGCEVLLKPLGYAVDPMCNTVRIQLPSILYIIDKLLIPSSICPYLNACLEPRTERRASKNSKKISKRFGKLTKSFANEIRIIHITDLHVESEYAEESNTNCGLPVCCLDSQGPGTAGYYGDYNCNIPQRTVELFLNSVKKMNPNLILLSGDIPPHTLWQETYTSQVQCTKMLTSTIQKILPNITVYPILGNHEFYPTNLFSVENLNYSKPFLQDFFTSWKPISNFSNDIDYTSITTGGLYSKKLSNGLKLISLNSNYMYTMNFYNVLNDMGRRAETSYLKNYLREQLEDSKLNNEKVILLSHHPPGNSDFIVLHSKWLEGILLDYSQQIVLVLVGHTHYDEFKMIYDATGAAKGVFLVSPSLTTKGARNPSMRLYRLDPTDFRLIDYDHYYLDLNTAFANSTDVESIKKLYSAIEEYRLPDLTPASWDQLLSSFETDDDLFRKHRRHSQADALSDADAAACTGRCKARYICRMRNFNYDEYLDCLPPVRTPSTSPPSTPPSRAGEMSGNHVGMILGCVVIGLVAKIARE